MKNVIIWNTCGAKDLFNGVTYGISNYISYYDNYIKFCYHDFNAGSSVYRFDLDGSMHTISTELKPNICLGKDGYIKFSDFTDITDDGQAMYKFELEGSMRTITTELKSTICLGKDGYIKLDNNTDSKTGTDKSCESDQMQDFMVYFKGESVNFPQIVLDDCAKSKLGCDINVNMDTYKDILDDCKDDLIIVLDKAMDNGGVDYSKNGMEEIKVVVKDGCYYSSVQDLLIVPDCLPEFIAC